MNPSLQQSIDPEQEKQKALLQTLQSPLRKLIEDRIDKEANTEKQFQYLRLRRCDLYYRDMPYLVPSGTGAAGSVDLVPLNSYDGVDRDAEAFGLYDYSFNQIKSYGRKFVPALGSRPFYNAKAKPRNPRSQADRETARQYDLLLPWLAKIWKLRLLNYELMFKMYTAGTVYGYVYMDADEDMFGTKQVPVMEPVEQQVSPEAWKCDQCGWEGPDAPLLPPPIPEMPTLHQCPQCGATLHDFQFHPAETTIVPTQTGTQSYPRSGPKLSLHSGYNVTVPQDVERIDNKTPWLVWQNEDNPANLLAMYGESIRALIKSGDATAEELFGATGTAARSAQTSIMGLIRSNLQVRTPHMRIWLHPNMYELIEDEGIRETLSQNFPKGVKVCRVGKFIVKLVPEVLDRRWAAAKPECSPTLYTDPYCWSMLGQQDLFNNFLNAAIAFAERKLPTTVVDPELGIADILNNRPSMPMEIIEASARAGRRLGDMMEIIPTPQGELDQYNPLTQMVDGHMQSLSGMLPPIWGAGEKQATADAQRSVLNQAIMQLSTTGEYASDFYATCFNNALRMVREEGMDTEAVFGQDDTSMVDMDSLRAGEAYLETDPGVPLTWIEKRQTLNDLIQQNPDLAHAMGLDLPENIPFTRDYVLPGMSEMRVPDEDVQMTVNETIRKLLDAGTKGFAAQQQPDGSWAMPPGVEVDSFADQPDKFVPLIKSWLVSQPGRNARDTNVNGYKLVIAWGLNEQMLMQPPAPVGPDGQPLPPPNGGPAPAPPAQPQPQAPEMEPQPA